jgi:hypothetical protein
MDPVPLADHHDSGAVVSMLAARLLAKGDFVPFIILKRRKDKGNEDQAKGAQVLMRHNVYSVKDFLAHEDEWMATCTRDNARLYMKVNKRTDKQVAGACLQLVAKLVAEEHYGGMRGAYDHAMGTTPSNEDRCYLLDVDYLADPVGFGRGRYEVRDPAKVAAELLARLRDVYALHKVKLHAEPRVFYTPGGLHIVAPAFDVAAFSLSLDPKKAATAEVKMGTDVLVYPGYTLDVKKDADVLVFAPVFAPVL